MQTSEEQENINVEYPNFVPADKSGNLTWIFSDGISMGQDVSNNGGYHDSKNEIFAWNCGSPEIDLKSFTISPCYGDPCTLHRGQEITLTALFTAKYSAKRLPCDLLAQWGPIKMHLGCPEVGLYIHLNNVFNVNYIKLII